MEQQSCAGSAPNHKKYLVKDDILDAPDPVLLRGAHEHDLKARRDCDQDPAVLQVVSEVTGEHSMNQVALQPTVLVKILAYLHSQMFDADEPEHCLAR